MCRCPLHVVAIAHLPPKPVPYLRTSSLPDVASIRTVCVPQVPASASSDPSVALSGVDEHLRLTRAELRHRGFDVARGSSRRSSIEGGGGGGGAASNTLTADEQRSFLEQTADSAAM